MFNSILFHYYIYMGNSLSLVMSYRLHKENTFENTYKLLKKKARKNNICNNVSNGEFFIKILSNAKLPLKGI